MPPVALSLLWRMPLALVVVALAAWAALALWFRGPESVLVNTLVVVVWVAVALTALTALLAPGLHYLRLAGLVVFALLFIGLCFWWQTIRPQQQRDWAPDVARLVQASHDGDRVTLQNVRNFAWHASLNDFTPRWEIRRYDLSALRSVDLVVSYWMGPAIAHTLVSFGFADGRQLVFSVEVRRERGQVFSPVADFFKQSELILVAADERDIVRTRSNVRGEQVYLYRVAMPQSAMRALFLAYIDEAYKLQRKPEFYNTLASNCTTIVYAMVKQIVPGLPYDWRLVLSGYLPNYIYDLGALDMSRAFAELQRRGHINARAIASDVGGHASEEFSRAIRRGVPAPDGRLIVVD